MVFSMLFHSLLFVPPSGLCPYKIFGAALLQRHWVLLSTAVNSASPFWRWPFFSAFHSAPSLPQVLLGGSRRLCRRLSTRPAPPGAGRFFLLSAGSSLPPSLVLLSALLIHSDSCVEGDLLRIASCFSFISFSLVFIFYNTVILTSYAVFLYT